MELHIEISDTYFVGSDKKQLIIYRRSFDDDGNVSKEYPIAFFSTVESLCIRLLDLVVMDSEAQSLNEILAEVKSVHETINEISLELGSTWKRLEP